MVKSNTSRLITRQYKPIALNNKINSTVNYNCISDVNVDADLLAVDVAILNDILAEPIYDDFFQHHQVESEPKILMLNVNNYPLDPFSVTNNFQKYYIANRTNDGNEGEQLRYFVALIHFGRLICCYNLMLSKLRETKSYSLDAAKKHLLKFNRSKNAYIKMMSFS